MEQIIREEMDRAGGQEVLLPTIQPAELWEQSGRAQSMNDVLFQLQDKRERAMVLAKAINPHLDTKSDVVKVREFLREQYPIGEDHPAAKLFSEDDRLHLLATQASNNEQLFRRWMPTYPADAYARLDTVEMLRAR